MPNVFHEMSYQYVYKSIILSTRACIAYTCTHKRSWEIVITTRESSVRLSRSIQDVAACRSVSSVNLSGNNNSCQTVLDFALLLPLFHVFLHQQVLPCTRQIMRKGTHRVWTRFLFFLRSLIERENGWRKILRSHVSWKRSRATSQISLCTLISDCHTLHNQILSLRQIHGVWVKDGLLWTTV